MEWIKRLNPGDELLVMDAGVNTYSAKVVRFYGSSRVLVEFYPCNKEPDRQPFSVNIGRNLVLFGDDLSLGNLCLMPKLVPIT